MLTPDQRGQWIEEAGIPQLCQVLYWRWDPIEVNDAFPYSEGEYDEYARDLAVRLARGASKADVAAYLEHVDRDLIGIGTAGSRSYREAAQMVMDWFGDSVEHWLEFGSRRDRRRR